ncbi:hypothetical protein SPF06_09080 [Sinomonas sp. JGH33]|uniref:SpaA-like prealbumin fold domain-containing protein n=1 Tax=Sinomonas terricola TaxID=3110330 RepID=A0ABU5T5D2_9MICC|nr:hypothetical protein [Sinomonas sp. JGH33]MEA5454873.1 hypothetical protein [Sinomonas sp. JGH33]
MRNRTITELGAGIACLALVLSGATAAQANLAGSTFEGNDGNLITNTAGDTDWNNVAGVHKGIDLPSGSGDNSFGQGTKEDNSNVSVVTGSIPPNKNDLTRFYEASETAGNGHTYLYLAWERLVNIGNANLDFEINQNPTSGFASTTTGPVTLNRTAGDVLVTYDFSGSGTPTLGINRWLTAAAGNTVSQCFSANSLPCWGSHTTLGSSSSEGAVNTVPVADPLQTPQAQLGVGLFGEASIDLTAAGVFPQGTCEAFGSAFAKSRSSSSFTAEIKDFIAPIPVSISNCGMITIHKVTENGDSTFNYAPTGQIGTAGFTLSNGGQKQYTGIQPGTSTITENLTAAQTAAGWTLKSLTCGTVTGANTSVTINGATLSVQMGAGGNVDCTYTNHINASPTIGTTLSATTVDLGGSVQDSATLTGATSTAGGTVTYTVYTNDTCTAGAQDAGTVSVINGVVPGSNAITFNTAGTYYWQAVYSGDANNNGATSPCTAEQVVVNKAQPTVATAQDLIPNDNFTLSGGFSPTGTVTFNLYAPSDATCSGTPVLSQTVSVNGNGTYSTANSTFHAITAGTWRWASSYSGDSNNLTASSACGVESFTIVNG